MAFCNQIRSFGGPASRFGSLSHSDFGMRRELRGDFHWPMIESWLEFPAYNNEQYLGIRHRHHHNPKSNSLKVDLGPGHIKSIYDVLSGMGLKETLRLAFNELLHLH
ncbi:GM10485 [Drosophila sechellia]|uniref:GM10485 n=1 Tax=Drosophila sechellia TaxID=7238 RepID=B4I4T0_DROSE|nr:GM10485 [Drosophila sechellia]